MLSTKQVEGRTIYLYGDTEISAEEYAALGGAEANPEQVEISQRVRSFTVHADGRIEEVGI